MDPFCRRHWFGVISVARHANALSVPDEPLWHEGMLLAPQHLQQLALRAERHVGFRFATADPHAFGVIHASIDQGALVSGMFRVDGLTAVMPDGLVVTLPQRDRDALEFDLTPYAERLRVEPLRIELAVPRDEGAADHGERFRGTEGDDEVDATLGQGRVRVPRSVPNLSLRAADRSTTRFTTLPLAEVVLRDEAYTETNYVPPRLLLDSGHPLTLEIGALVRRMREKAVYLSERARSQGALTGNDEGEALRAPLRAVSEPLPELEALTASGAAHPFRMHCALCRAAGSAAGLTRFAVPPQGRGYHHDDIRASLAPLITFIDRCLDQVRQEFMVVPFEQTARGFRLDLRTQRPREALVVGAQVSPGRSPESTWAWLSESLIAAENQLDRLRQRRVPGAGRELLDRDSAARYTLAGDTLLFQVDLDDDYVTSDDVLEIVNTDSGRREDKPIQLYAYVSPSEAEDGSSGGNGDDSPGSGST